MIDMFRIVICCMFALYVTHDLVAVVGFTELGESTRVKLMADYWMITLDCCCRQRRCMPTSLEKSFAS